jgi:hypothetical protein
MPDINEVIKREVNPFGLINLRPSNFWAEKQDSALMVESIHQAALTQIEEHLDLVAKSHRSLTTVLIGDSGSGKSYLLGRIQRTLKSKAFFVYILCNWADSSNIWRHILRATIDSLVQVPEGEQDSQLMLWLKSLSAFTKSNSTSHILQLLQSDRQNFIKHLKATYKQAGIYNPDIFFGLLHDLTNPQLYDLACEWLRGDDLSEESMQALNVKSCIDTEDMAKNILANFGKISTQTQPIVLCFDNLDSLPMMGENLLDVQPLFTVNTTIHGESLKNFLVIISVVTNTWKRNRDRIQPADIARINHQIQLKSISLEQAEALWAYNLHSLHQAANPQPETRIFPLSRELLDKYFPGGKTNPRNTLLIGKGEYQEYKNNITGIGGGAKVNITAEFELLWEQEYKKIQGKITRISLLSSPELMKMLQVALEALEVAVVTPKLLPGKYASYSLSYQPSPGTKKIGIIWTEDANMKSFFHVMSGCQRAIQENLCDKLVLIRISNVGSGKMAGYQIYSKIFNYTQHIHIKPNLPSVHYLATYYSLVNSALAQELVLGYTTINLQTLQNLIRKSEILQNCTLLQNLGIVTKKIKIEKETRDLRQVDLRPVQNFLFNIVKTQNFMGVKTLVSQATRQYPDVKETDIQHLINLLCQEKKVKILNPKAQFSDQLICLKS